MSNLQPSQPASKICKGCNILKPASNYRIYKVQKKYYLYPYCKNCVLQQQKAKYHSKRFETPVPDLPSEQWKPVVKYEGLYVVSNFARIKRILASVPHNASGYIRRKEKLLTQNKTKDGYRKVILSKENKHRVERVHIIVWEAWGDEDRHKPGYVIDHNDNNKDNNAISNLRLITHRLNNSKDSKRKHSKYLGVSKHSNKAKSWEANICIDGKKKRLGLFYTEEDAAKAYQNALSLLDEG
jgi:hypothetical protein